VSLDQRFEQVKRDDFDAVADVNLWLLRNFLIVGTSRARSW
jgi:hypothetical protein